MSPVGLSSVTIGIATLRANPLRTALSTLGIIVGSASLVAVLALGDGLQRYGRQQIEQTTDLQSVVLQPRTSVFIDGQVFPVDSYPVFGSAEAASLVAATSSAGGASITLTGTAWLRGPAADSVEAAVVATLSSAAEVFAFPLLAGRYFTEDEAHANAPVVVLTQGLAERLTGRPAPAAIGRQVRLRARDRTIIGIRAARNREQNGAAFVPLEAEGDALAPTPRLRARDLVLQARTVEEVAAVEREAEAWLASRYGDWRRVIRVSSNQARVAQAAQGFLVFKLALGAITGISLVVGGIGIMNVLLAAVTERTREIGIRKAVGARRREVLVQFLAESVAIAGLGSGVGAAIGLGSAFAITSFIRGRTQAQVYAAFSWETLAVSAGAALLVGIVFGMYPALRAARLPPVEAIRHE